MAKPSSNPDRDRWIRALAAKGGRAASAPLNRNPRAGIGPNKASGHKGGISRQGSKRG